MVHYQPVDISDADNVNVTHQQPLKELGKLTMGLALVVITAVALLSILAEALVWWMPAQLDEQLGDMLAAGYAKDYPTAPAPAYAQAEKVFKKLIAQQPAHHPRYTLHVIEDAETVNAMAAPGGHIYLFSGILEKLESDDALAFVLGHEMGHVQHRHALKGVGRTVIVTTALSLLFADNNGVFQALQSMATLEQLHHSRQQEMDADQFGMAALIKAGYSPKRSLQFFDALKKADDAPRYTVSIFSTHPADDERMAALEHYAALP